jgi:nucleotide-binding universal stress UspA family protein
MEMRIIVASDGEPAAVGALRVARALAERDGAPVEVVCAVPPFPVPPSHVGAPEVLAMDDWARAACDAARVRVRAQLEEMDPWMATWPITVEIGAPSLVIVRRSQTGVASLIVMGLGRHALADRWFGTETALKLLRAGGVLHLAHVFWRPSEEIPWVGGRDWIQLQRERMQAELYELARQLDGSATVRVESHFLEGDPAAETLRFANRIDAELIVAGSHGAGFLSRLLMGSVSTRLVRGATCMVLIAPPRGVVAELKEGVPAGEKRVPAAALYAVPPA